MESVILFELNAGVMVSREERERELNWALTKKMFLMLLLLLSFVVAEKSVATNNTIINNVEAKNIIAELRNSKRVMFLT